MKVFAPCGCPTETCRPEIVDASLEVDYARAFTFRCSKCSQTFTLRSAPFPFVTDGALNAGRVAAPWAK